MRSSSRQPPVVHRLLAGLVAVGVVTTGATSCSDRAPLSGEPGGLAGVTAEVKDPTTPPEQAGHQWAPAAKAVLTPGVQTYTRGSGQCTANFVFTDGAGNVYLG